MRSVYVQALVYADNIALIVKSKEELQNAVTEWVSAIRDRRDESKVMVIAGK